MLRARASLSGSACCGVAGQLVFALVGGDKPSRRRPRQTRRSQPTAATEHQSLRRGPSGSSCGGATGSSCGLSDSAGVLPVPQCHHRRAVVRVRRGLGRPVTLLLRRRGRRVHFGRDGGHLGRRSRHRRRGGENDASREPPPRWPRHPHGRSSSETCKPWVFLPLIVKRHPPGAPRLGSSRPEPPRRGHAPRISGRDTTGDSRKPRSPRNGLPVPSMRRSRAPGRNRQAGGKAARVARPESTGWPAPRRPGTRGRVAHGAA